MIPGVFPSERGNVHGWLPFRLVGGIGDGAELGDVVLIDVELPPRISARPRDRPVRAGRAGSGFGPQVPSVHRGAFGGVVSG